MKEPIQPGFYRISNDEYHSGPGVSRSYLHTVESYTPAHAKVPVETTPIMQFGTDFHTATLEPERFDAEYVTLPMNCKPGSGPGMKERKETFMKMVELQNQTMIDPDNLNKIRHMRDAVFNHPLAKDLLSDGEPELSGFWNDPAHDDILCKMRMDWINKSKRIIVDLKKTHDARPHRFKSLAYDMGYDMEAGFYLYGATQITGVEHHDFYFIVCEDREPWGVIVYKADVEMINHGLTRCSKAITKHMECVKNDNWPCYSTEIHELTLPGWVKRNQDTMIIE